jgi:hypothetical protein
MGSSHWRREGASSKNYSGELLSPSSASKKNDYKFKWRWLCTVNVVLKASIALSYKPRPFILTDRKDVQHKDVDIIRKLTFGLEKLDK